MMREAPERCHLTQQDSIISNREFVPGEDPGMYYSFEFNSSFLSELKSHWIGLLVMDTEG